MLQVVGVSIGVKGHVMRGRGLPDCLQGGFRRPERILIAGELENILRLQSLFTGELTDRLTGLIRLNSADIGRS